MSTYKRTGNRPGRKPGFSPKVIPQDVKELLALNAPNIVNKAIALATSSEPNMVILSKLLDKILPSLQAGSLEMNAKIKGSLDSVPEDKLKDMVVEFSKYAAEANNKLEAKKKKS